MKCCYSLHIAILQFSLSNTSKNKFYVSQGRICFYLLQTCHMCVLNDDNSLCVTLPIIRSKEWQINITLYYMSPFETTPTPARYPLALDLITLVYLNFRLSKLHVGFHWLRDALHKRTPCSKCHWLTEYCVLLKCETTAEGRPSSVAVLQWVIRATTRSRLRDSQEWLLQSGRRRKSLRNNAATGEFRVQRDTV